MLVALRDIQLSLYATQLQVVLSQFRQQRQGDAAAVLDRGQRVGILRLHRATHLAEQVQFPRGADAVLPEIVLERRAGGRLDQRKEPVRALLGAGVL